MGRVTTGDVMGVTWIMDREGEDITIEGSGRGTELIDVTGTEDEVGEPPAVVGMNRMAASISDSADDGEIQIGAMEVEVLVTSISGLGPPEFQVRLGPLVLCSF